MSIYVTDRTRLITGIYGKRLTVDIEFIMIHRFGWGLMSEWKDRKVRPSAEGVAGFYASLDGKPTGGKMPYTFVVNQAGSVEQARPITDITPHGRSYNRRSVGVAVLGDFRKFDVPKDQWNSLVELVALLKERWPLSKVVGHTDMPGASADKNKICPGYKLSTVQLEGEADKIKDARAGILVAQYGIVL